MAFNGSGVFNRLYSWATDKSNSVPVTASRMDSEMDGFATGLSNCLTLDGQSLPTAAIPFNGQNITGAGTIGATKFSAVSQPCFSAHKNGTDQTGIASGVATKLTFTTEVFDIGSYYDAANSKWTPPAGAVQVTAFASFTNQLDNTVAQLGIFKNGTVYKKVLISASFATNDGLFISIIDRANGTDYYEIYITAFSSTTITVSGIASSGYFMGLAI